jgi:hypothetical protein
MNFKKMLEERFKDEASIGVYTEDANTGLDEAQFSAKYPDRVFEGISLLPGGKNFFICTNSADLVIETLGEGLRFGFDSENNPAATHPEIEGAGGHDFAVIRNRYIVDLWISHYTGCEDQHVFDLWDKKDHPKIKEIFGDLTAWELAVEGAGAGIKYKDLPKGQAPRLRSVVLDAELAP